MGQARLRKTFCVLGNFFGIALALSGCHSMQRIPAEPPSNMAREVHKVALPPYMIQPPDILQIDALRLVPLPPYRIEPLDSVFLHVTGTVPEEPISGVFPVEPTGMIKLGYGYGNIKVEEMTTDEAKLAIENHLKDTGFLKTKVQQISLAETQGIQQVRGPHLVRPDGTVGLGVYGSVFVTGLTIEAAKEAIEEHLSKSFKRPKISLDVAAFNSMVYYVIFDGGGFGATMMRLPVTGNETVLDALTQVNGLPAVSSKHQIWVARPAPPELGCDQILPVDLNGIVQRGQTATNYQLLPGDRIYVRADKLIETDNWLSKILAPVERTFGFILLGSSTVRSFRSDGFNNGFRGF
jgi:polysaccharide export outer membrane protein